MLSLSNQLKFLLAITPERGFVLPMFPLVQIRPQPPRATRPPLRAAAALQMALALTLIAAPQATSLLHAAPEPAEDFSPLTNRLQLAQSHDPNQRFQWTADLTGTVLVGGHELAVVEFDNLPPARLIDARGAGAALLAGQRIRYRGNWLSGPDSDRPDHWTTVNNDGTHSLLASQGQAVLTAGRHPLRLLYFNRKGESGLAVDYEGPGLPRQRIPATALWRQSTNSTETNWIPGLEYRYFAGDWPSLASLPHYFASLTPLATGTVDNFTLSPALTTTNFGLEFTGFIEVPRTGRYEFTLSSDDGSLLFVDEAAPEITGLGRSTAPPPPTWAAGQVWSPTNEVAPALVSGTVTFTRQTDDDLEVELTGSSGRTLVHVLKPAPLTPQLLNDSHLCAAGLAQRALTPEGLEIVGQLLAPAAESLQIQNLPNRVWNATPAETIAGLKTISPTNRTPIFKLAGQLRQPPDNQPWQLTDGTGQMPILFGSTAPPANGQPVEMLVARTRGADRSWSTLAWRPNLMADGKAGPALPLLTSIEEIKKLTRAEAQRGYPVKARGVVTYFTTGNDFFLQDASWSIDVRATNLDTVPRVGEYWEVEGATFAEFAPNVRADKARRIGAGTLPAPAHPTLIQLMDGSLDTQYIEVQGVVSAVTDDRVMLLTSEGRIRIQLPNLPPAVLEETLNAMVRIRGCVIPGREFITQQVLIGELGLVNAQLGILRPAPKNIFATPARSVPDLRLFDAQGTSLQRVKVRGQILHQRGQEFFFQDGPDGARFVPKATLKLPPGDVMDIVGFPDLKGATPLLRDAVVQWHAHEALPVPIPIAPEELLNSGHDSTRVQIEAELLSQRHNQVEQILELQTGARTFLARLQNTDGYLPELRPASRLTLRGVYVGLGGDRVAGRKIDGFEVLLNNPGDVRIVRRPPWWSTRHTLVTLALLGAGLLLAITWIQALRRRVTQRTLALTVEIEDHKRTEHQLELKTHMLEREIEERRRMEQEIEKGHRQLLATSRLAGMAEVATSVLHNVGNVMTSVNVLSSAIVKQVHRSKAANLTRLGDLLRQNQAQLGHFVTADQRGKLLPAYISDLGGHLAQEQTSLLEKVSALNENVHHINEIVALQQDYASVSGLLEKVTPVELVEDALRMHGESLTRHRIAVGRDFSPLPPVTIDRHKVLQILFNLLENAKHACLQTDPAAHQITVSLRPRDGGMFELGVADNGVGIPAENLPRLFDQGFSTRRDGHGFGLHSSILMAQDMGGTLMAHSAGPGCGAAFTLRLPFHPPRPAAHPSPGLDPKKLTPN